MAVEWASPMWLGRLTVFQLNDCLLLVLMVIKVLGYLPAMVCQDIWGPNECPSGNGIFIWVLCQILSSSVEKIEQPYAI